MRLQRDDALALLHEYTKNPNLIKHMLAAEAAMRAYARKFDENEEWWGIVGLLHDFDYERYPSLSDHPFRGAEILRAKGFPEEFVNTILAHAPHTGVPRDILAKKAIFAVDELCGFLVAVALVKPHKRISEVDVASVKKKMNAQGFARQVKREEIIQGAQELGVSLDDHIYLVLSALQSIAIELGL